MRAERILALAFTLSLPALAAGQVTHGQKPKLPPPYATNSSGNGPRGTKPRRDSCDCAGGISRETCTRQVFKVPRWLTVAPNGDIFLADNGRAKSS